MITGLLAVAGTPTAAPRRAGRGRQLLRGFLAAASVATFVVGAGGVASADTATGTTTGRVVVSSATTLIAVTSANFTLTGLPTETVSTAGGSPQSPGVDYTVTTNAAAGYSVTVEAAGVLVGTGTNPDTIPVAALSVTGDGGTNAPLNALTPTSVHNQTGRSNPAGDHFHSDYSLTIPFVASDTYTTTISYVVTTH